MSDLLPKVHIAWLWQIYKSECRSVNPKSEKKDKWKCTEVYPGIMQILWS